MAVLTITCDYDGDVTDQGTKDDTFENVNVGVKYKEYPRRVYIRFPLTDLPSNVVISQVRLYVHCNNAGGSAHLTDIHAYGTNGQEDPQQDTGLTLYDRCASGNLYVDDSDALRTEGDKWFVLGGSVAQDIVNAKNSVNRFSLALHEEGDNDSAATLATLESTGFPYPAKLEITYEVVAVIETITANRFPMLYLAKPVKAQELISKVEGATLVDAAKDFPKYLLKKGKANELKSKWT